MPEKLESTKLSMTVNPIIPVTITGKLTELATGQGIPDKVVTITFEEEKAEEEASD